MTYGMATHDSQRMSHHDFGNHLTFHLALVRSKCPLDKYFVPWQVMSKTIGQIPIRSAEDIHDHQSMNHYDFGDAQTFLLVLQSG